MADRINTGVSNNYLTSFYEQPPTLDETQTVAAAKTQENQSKPPRKLPPVGKTVSFTALGCDTESKLTRAGYMAAAAKAGIADVAAQNRFADQMLAQNPQLTLNGTIDLDDAKVKSRLLNREVDFTIDDRDKTALEQFRAQYVEGDGKIRFNRTPTIDLRQAQTADGVSSPTNSPPNTKFRVLLNNDGKPISEQRVLAQYAENQYGGGNLWGQNYQQIAELSAAQGVKPKITNITRVGNKTSVEFELAPRDRAVVHENYKTVQAEVNRARAAYEDFANNNEVSSFLRGVFNGAVGSIKGTIGLLNVPETMKALWQVVSNPIETFNALYKELGETWEEFKNAPANKKSEMVGELVGAAVVEILLGKGIGKFGSILAKTKTGAELLEKAKLLKSATTAKIAEAFSDEAASAASTRLRQRLAGTQLYSGIPADALADLAIVSANKIKNGAVKFADFSKQMIDEAGEKVKPYLEKLYREQMVKLKLADKIDEVGIKVFEIKPPLEGKVNYQVHDPSNIGRTIVDIDRFEGNILWEEKSATSGVNKITGIDETPRWIAKHITKKFEDLVEARKHLPDFYKDAEIGFDFVKSGADPKFKAAVETEVKRLSQLHPDIKIRVNWR